MSVDPAMWDVVGRIIVELRDDPRVNAIVGTRVRSPEPAPGDVQPKGAYVAFIVVVTAATPRHPQVPISTQRHFVRCYGRTPVEAQSLYEAASDALHAIGPRVTGSGRAIYVSHDDTGASEDSDPDTRQPVYSFVVETIAATQVVTT